MALSAIGTAALVAREALKTTAYKDSVGVWTIGVGHTSAAGAPKVTPGLSITEAEALSIFARDLAQYEAAVDKAVKVPLSENERDALVSICYNIGPGAFSRSTFVKRLNAGDRAGCAEAIMQWRKPPEIVSRRTAERDQFLTPYSAALPKARSTDRARVGEGAKPAKPKPASDRMAPIPAGKWAEDVLLKPEVEMIQKRLRDLGFFIVGKVDGKWGIRTEAAIKALQLQAGISTDGHWGPQTRAALFDDANAFKPDPARAKTTAADLRAQGSTIAIGGNRIQWSSVWSVLLSIGGVFVYMAQNWNGATPDLPFPFNLVLPFMPPWLLPVLVIGFNLYNALLAKGVVNARVLAERTGLHNGEPDPAPSPPVTTAPDGPRPGGLIGWLLPR
ncbi:GH24 family phage-related lysozyme (muramidase)/peptidoglycan hydrolase-like protein with peptidoglycan-binding domain [Methylobacterium sp. BE186]|uniref:glycoside hydrolase family protein n=1 Tax=Methylobacterium sp. BE186 TaxID=2817715 RepID=UPI00285493AB|nr:glycoside hydrolase family protein [Methylobacterium sp. BE186]MDR7037410.1 GH24 family phage-related lysozyme (muramidase)/peptidoglycan hydrolase-like protein with peptidoglycan-binding domain [Methylobacterium sp. BE186]